MKKGIRFLLGLFAVFMMAAILPSFSLAARTFTGLENQAPDVSFVDLLKKMDKNYDNRISKAEWTGNEIWFAIYDEDRNGILVQREYESVTKDYQQGLDQGHDDYATDLHVIDKDHDGKISASEFAAYPNPFTQQPSSASDADKDKDGFISENEFAAWWAFEYVKAKYGPNKK